MESLTDNQQHIPTKKAIEEELKAGAKNFHVIGVWVAILFDPVFGFTDYLNFPDDWHYIMIFRLSVSVLSLITLWQFKRGNISVYTLVAIPFALISFQNAFTYSLLETSNLMTHNLNYLALFMGAALFLVWPAIFSIIAVGASFIATVIFVLQNPALDLNEFAREGGLLLSTGAIFTILLVQARYRLRKLEIKARLGLKENLRINAEQKEKLEQQTKELHAAKEEIERINDDLEETVNERTKKLRKSNDEMNRLVYSLSHDFKTPLVNLRGLLELVRSTDDKQQLDVLYKEMNGSLNRFDNLLNDMNSYSIYWEKEIEVEEFNPKQLIDNLWKQLRFMHENNVELTITGSDQLFIGDSKKLNVVLRSILSNAVIYQKDEGENRVSVDIDIDNNSLIMSIEDNGEGIDKEIKDKIFDLFYRGNPKSTGAGIGLYIARGIIENMGGKLTLQSEPNEFTRVEITVPRQ
ncbi:sensor histidine kinase [Salibacter halophilus]|uniref:histidine kinase n=1 Tax=Salibacter halophilus TaxID=1803916 RepID=A0A6N6M3E3_9FLAO|nr:HAMP domain-containing sensor histidine kinase [Salibacter halophilus]KAB1063665.1 HAMP domain-containing histidine kinase [Salibacter halophilus]